MHCHAALTMCLRNTCIVYTLYMSFLCHSNFFVPISCQFRFGRRQGCLAEPFSLHQLPYPAGHKESRLRRRGKSRRYPSGDVLLAAIKRGERRAGTGQRRNAAVAGGSPLQWGEFDWGNPSQVAGAGPLCALVGLGVRFDPGSCGRLPRTPAAQAQAPIRTPAQNRD